MAKLFSWTLYSELPVSGEKNMKLGLGADSSGLSLKVAIKTYLIESSHEVVDFGVESTSDATPYYQTAHEVAKGIQSGKFERAVLVCGTGMGMSIIANKHKGVYAAVCESAFTAGYAGSINQANVLALGAMVTTPEMARDIVSIWLNTPFTMGWPPAEKTWLENAALAIVDLEEKLFDCP